jgi:hypothetical protein
LTHSDLKDRTAGSETAPFGSAYTTSGASSPAAEARSAERKESASRRGVEGRPHGEAVIGLVLHEVERRKAELRKVKLAGPLGRPQHQQNRLVGRKAGSARNPPRQLARAAAGKPQLHGATHDGALERFEHLDRRDGERETLSLDPLEARRLVEHIPAQDDRRPPGQLGIGNGLVRCGRQSGGGQRERTPGDETTASEAHVGPPAVELICCGTILHLFAAGGLRCLRFAIFGERGRA